MKAGLSALVVLVSSLVVSAAAPAPARASCRVAEFTFTPTDALQIVIWLEDSTGAFVDTIFITETTGSYGLGNRPGMMTFNSEFLWPYGRRDSLFPVWAHRRGVTYPRLVFQDNDDMDLSHAISHSSIEPHYCRPLRVGEVTWNVSVDAGTCATATYTDKGHFSPTDTSLYPPRSDITSPNEGVDHADVAMFAAMNDLDAVSRATPEGGMPYTFRVSLPDSIPDGAYVAYIEVSKEFDQNGSYDFASPTGIPWSDYGEAYRGQPSVIWQVPITVGATDDVQVTVDYLGYGEPAGLNGDLSPPDGTITENVEGSGAGRLLVGNSPEGPYRFRVAALASDDVVPPGAPGSLQVNEMTPLLAGLSFLAPGDEGVPVTAYEVRYLAGTPLTEANFVTEGQPIAEGMPIMLPGALQTFTLELRPETHYWVGVRALDQCLNPGPLEIVDFVSPKQPYGEVDACFVATAAWGSPLEADVSMLRRFRDQALRSQALGEIFVETYYTFGPAFAAVVEPSDTLRSLVRTSLDPLVALAGSVVR